MSVYIFTALFYFLLLFLLLCGTLCEKVSVDGAVGEVSATAKTIKIFTKDGKITGGAKGPNRSEAAKEVEVKDFYSSVIVSAGEYIVALAGINRIDEDKKINIVTNYIEKNNLLTAEDFSKPDVTWTTQFAVQTDEINDVEKVVKGMLAVAKGDKIYFLSVNYSTKKGTSPNIDDLAFKLAVGATEVISGTQKEKNFKWEERPLTVGSVVGTLKEKLKDTKEGDFSFSGSAFLVKDNIVFALVAENNNKKITVLMQLKNDERESAFDKTKLFENCYSYFFPWKTKIMMISANCGTSTNNKIKELGDDWEKWNESSQAFSQQNDFLQNKHDFVTIKNETTEILLFTEHSQNPQPTGQAIKKINLWMSDGIRLKNIGEIAAASEKVTPVKFWFEKGKLFSLNQELKSGGKEIESVTLKYLEEQSTQIISTANAWKKADDKISTFCNGEEALKIFCNTNGLVGFLSGNAENSNTKWENEYLNVDAIVTPTGNKGKTEKIEHGFKFSGEGLEAKWSMNKETKEQPYKFTDPGFTLVATVTVGNGTNGKENSILGVGLTDKTTVALWCTTNGKWAVKAGKNDQKKTHLSDINCTDNEKYYVAVILNKKNDKIFIYVDGEQIPKSENEGIPIEQSQNINYFYFGADKETENAKTDVTITDVLLYNRPFEKEKIIQLKPKKEKKLEPEEKREGDTSDLPQPDESTIQTDSSSPGTSATPTTTEKDGAETKLCLRSMNSITVLSLLLSVGFTLLGRSV